jgi:hypothetical protein
MTRPPALRLVSLVLSVASVVLVIAGLLAWLARLIVAALPGMSDQAPFISFLLVSANSAKIDISGFVGAAVTTLSVIISILIAYNIGMLQIAGQTISLALTRTMIRTLVPALLLWLTTIGVSLIYLLMPSTLLMGQLVQVLLWFGASALLIIGYLLSLPWYLSGEYAAMWAIRDLRGNAIATWESQDGFSVLQAGLAAAITRTDLRTARAMSLALGGFLPGVIDRAAELETEYNRERYRALKNLLTGCSQHAASAPTAVAYNLGFITAGILLQAVAINQPAASGSSDLFSGLTRELHDTPDRLDALWTGTRHGLCRRMGQEDPYLVRYWRARARLWKAGDPRKVNGVAVALLRLHTDLWNVLSEKRSAEEASEEASEMLVDLYRYVATHLAQQAGPDRPALLLEALHNDSSSVWPRFEPHARDGVAAAYERYRAVLAGASTSSPKTPALSRVPAEVRD